MTEILESLKKAVLEYDNEGAATWARKAMEEGVDPTEALDALTEAIRQVGHGYGKGELWLPDLIGAASAMTSAMPIIEERITTAGEESRVGTIVAGTVYGDIHNIGKDMVIALARAAGFKVIDLGVDVPADKFVDAIKKYKADILVMSALLTTTAYVQKEVIEALKQANIRDRVKVVVGGGPITQEFANMIGADGYSPTAPMAVALFEELISVV